MGNGGLSVFVHEYGHDLGLPDAYDTSGGGDNNNEHWTLMAQSRLNAEGEPLGTRPGDFGAWEKLQLGWLDYEVVAHDDTRSLDLGPQDGDGECGLAHRQGGDTRPGLAPAVQPSGLGQPLQRAVHRRPRDAEFGGDRGLGRQKGPRRPGAVADAGQHRRADILPAGQNPALRSAAVRA